MNNPLTIATEVLRRDAAVWEDQSMQAKNIADMATEACRPKTEAGLFQNFYDVYLSAVAQVVVRSDEARKNLQSIAGLLRRAADKYDAQESKNVGIIENTHRGK